MLCEAAPLDKADYDYDFNYNTQYADAWSHIENRSPSERTSGIYPTPQLKIYDDYYSSNVPRTIDTDGRIDYWQPPNNGVGQGQLIGQQFNVKGYAWNFIFNQNPTNGTETNPLIEFYVRFMVIWDKQPNEDFADVTDVISNGLTGEDLITAFPNPANQDRFIILRDQCKLVSPNGNQACKFQGYQEINRRSIQGASDNEPATGAVCTIIVSDVTNPTDAPLFYGAARLYYTNN